MINPSSSRTAFDRVREAVESVPATERFQARDILARYPEFGNDRSALLDLAYEEYCQAVERGDTIDLEAFAAQFPLIKESLLELLEVHSFVVGNSLLSAVEPEAHWPTAGEVFLGFELLEEIGKGAFSRVFLAREVGLGGRQVVVKVSQKGAAEATMLGLLDHPHIVPVHSITVDEAIQLSALCMPYLGRTTANEWIQTRFKASSAHRVRSPRHLQTVIEIGKGVCQGLKFAHRHQVLHCDIKPSNILITHDGEPLLLDFNLSTNRSEERHLVGGTLLYMAPEQLRRAAGDRSAKITESTDVFCLAATLYQMATGQLPFPVSPNSNPRLNEIIEAALEARRVFPGQSHPLSEPLLSTLREALAFDPQDRIPSANEFYNRLSACQDRLSRRHRRWMRTAAAFGFLALGIAFLDQMNGHRPPAVPPQQLAEISNPPAHPEVQPLAPPASKLNDLLEQARKAEAEARYPAAITICRQILDLPQDDPGFTPAVEDRVKHSLAFCLLMDGHLIEANHLFAELQARMFADEKFALNQSACGILLCLTEDGLNDDERVRKTKQAVIQTLSTSGNIGELHFALAVLEAMLIQVEQGDSRIAGVRRVLRHTKAALDRGLSKRKALAIGHLLPEANAEPPLSFIIQNDPELAPDLEVEIPVRSPATGESRFAKRILP